jgi:hypothetical protein
MPSSPQDAATQSASSKAAQANNDVLTQNAQKNQTYADNTRSSLFGTYDPVTNSYSGS